MTIHDLANYTAIIREPVNISKHFIIVLLFGVVLRVNQRIGIAGYFPQLRLLVAPLFSQL